MNKTVFITLIASLCLFNSFGQTNSNINSTAYKFKEPENTVCFVCDHVLNKERIILYAAHDKEDGLWQFLCGQNDHTVINAKLISLKQATEIDATINDLFEMPLGVGAERKSKSDKWIPFRIED
jgi:hypothetical protein